VCLRCVGVSAAAFRPKNVSVFDSSRWHSRYHCGFVEFNSFAEAIDAYKEVKGGLHHRTSPHVAAAVLLRWVLLPRCLPNGDVYRRRRDCCWQTRAPCGLRCAWLGGL
jgi:hypothetical protein